MNVATEAAPEGLTFYRYARGGNVIEYVPTRRDLREALEAYASRLGMPARALRHVWRREGLRLLHVPGYADADTTSGLCACAPGVAVETAYVDWPDDLPTFDGGAS